MKEINEEEVAMLHQTRKGMTFDMTRIAGDMGWRRVERVNRRRHGE
jgi:hypothetical protein